MTEWSQFLGLIPSEGNDSPAARFLLALLTHVDEQDAEVLAIAQALTDGTDR